MKRAAILDRLFPASIDNRFPGHRLAVWLFGLFVALRLIMGTNSILNTRAVATGADGMSLDSLPAAAAESLLLMFALLSLSQLMLALLSLIALVRYKALIPLMYLVLLVEHLGRRALVLTQATDRAGTAPIGAYINMGLLALLVLGIALSLLGTPRATRSSA